MSECKSCAPANIHTLFHTEVWSSSRRRWKLLKHSGLPEASRSTTSVMLHGLHPGALEPAAWPLFLVSAGALSLHLRWCVSEMVSVHFPTSLEATCGQECCTPHGVLVPVAQLPTQPGPH